MIILFAIFIVACVFWVYWIVQSRRMDLMTKSLPEPPSLPLVGHALLFIGNTEKILKNIEMIAGLAFKHKGVSKIWLGPKMYVAIGNPEDAQIVLENCLDKDVVYRFLRPWLGHGLFIAPLNLWKCHRKVLLPVFHNKIVEEYIGVIAEQADVLVERLSEQNGQKEFDVLKYITACTLDIVFETAMGERMDVQHCPDTPYLRARNTVMTILNMRLFKVWMQPDCLFNLTHYAKEQKTNIELTHKFTDEVMLKVDTQNRRACNKGRMNIKEAKKVCQDLGIDRLSFHILLWRLPEPCSGHMTRFPHLADDVFVAFIMGSIEVVKKRRLQYEKNRTPAESAPKKDGKLRAVLDILFGKEFEFTDEQLREHIDSITIAGNDTTALVISYTLVLLGIHQDSQERVLQEQESIFGSSHRGATKDDLHKMHYLERVIKESMRLYTVVPIIARNIDKDIYLPGCDVTLPAGTGAVVGSFAIHRSEASWGPNANDYDPDRFLPERSTSRHPAAFLPFSYGSRNCIGRNFGMLIMKSIISSVVRSYKMYAEDVGRLKIEMLLFPIKGHLIKIEERIKV